MAMSTLLQWWWRKEESPDVLKLEEEGNELWEKEGEGRE